MLRLVLVCFSVDYFMSKPIWTWSGRKQTVDGGQASNFMADAANQDEHEAGLNTRYGYQ